MRHQKHKNKLGVAPSHRKLLMRNLCAELLDHKKIQTTHARCKALQSYVEKLVTIAKEDSVHNRRLAQSKLDNKSAVRSLFDEVAPQFKERNGGYTRIVKKAVGRWNDNAPMSFISFVAESASEKSTKKQTTKAESEQV